MDRNEEDTRPSNSQSSKANDTPINVYDRPKVPILAHPKAMALVGVVLLLLLALLIWFLIL